MSSLAQEESRSISENCTWGQRKLFSDGKVTVPFKRFLGYDRGPDGNLVVNPEQAAVVQEIYRLFLSLTERYNQTNTELTDITKKIDHMELAAAALTDFQKSLREQKDVLTEFESQAWYSLVDYATVYAKDDIRFTFKNGSEIKV